MIRSARISQTRTVAEIAERAGVSRGLIHRIEKGAPGCSIGVVFEVAAILGLSLFEADPKTLSRYLTLEREKLVLLPQSARVSQTKIRDDF